MDKRECIRCQKTFAPKSKFNFLCSKCASVNLNKYTSVYDNNIFRRDINNPNKVHLPHIDYNVDHEIDEDTQEEHSE